MDKTVYTPDEELVRLQEKMLEILKVTVALCEKHQLRYVLGYGTLLGAVRHQGFIPWDDDVDIVMPREDFEKFKAVAVKELEAPYFFQDYTTDEEYPSTVAKVRDSSTTLVENGYRNLKKMNHGIWVDVFVADCYNQASIIARNRYLQARILRRMLLERASNKGLFAKLCRVFPRRFLFLRCEKMLRKMGKGNEENGIVLTEAFEMKSFDDTIEMNFEGLSVRVPREYDRILKNSYGDYMAYPPESERVPRHMTEIVSVDKPYSDFFARS